MCLGEPDVKEIASLRTESLYDKRPFFLLRSRDFLVDPNSSNEHIQRELEAVLVGINKHPLAASSTSMDFTLSTDT